MTLDDFTPPLHRVGDKVFIPKAGVLHPFVHCSTIAGITCVSRCNGSPASNHYVVAGLDDFIPEHDICTAWSEAVKRLPTRE